jgi:hypothetical protein
MKQGTALGVNELKREILGIGKCWKSRVLTGQTREKSLKSQAFNETSESPHWQSSHFSLRVKD